MQTIHSILFVFHILFGGMAMLLFWVPMLAKKGSLDHIKFGRYYANTMYLVAATGALMALMVLLMPLTLKANMLVDGADPDKLALKLRVFWGFLLYLSVLTFVSIRQGQLVILSKFNHHIMRSPMHLLSIALLFLAGILILLLGIYFSSTLHIVFAIIGIVVALQVGRYCAHQSVTKGQWLAAHLGAFIGSGIAAYTAFFAFGGSRLFTQLGSYQILFWVAPGIIGTALSWYLSRKYKGTQAAT